MPFISNGIYDSGSGDTFISSPYPSTNIIKVPKTLWNKAGYVYNYICSENRYNVRFHTIFAYNNKLIFPGLFNDSGKLLWYDYNMNTLAYTEHQLTLSYSYESEPYKNYYAVLPLYQISGLKWFTAIAYMTCSGTMYLPRICKFVIIDYANGTATELNYNGSYEFYGYNARFASDFGILLTRSSDIGQVKCNLGSNTVTLTNINSTDANSAWIFKKDNKFYWFHNTAWGSFELYDSGGNKLYNLTINGDETYKPSSSDGLYIMHIKNDYGLLYTTSAFGTGAYMYLTGMSIKDVDFTKKNVVMEFKHSIGSLTTQFTDNGTNYEVTTTTSRPVIIDRSNSTITKIYLFDENVQSDQVLLVQYVIQED